MKKDIEIPDVSGVFVAAVRQKNEAFRSMDWNAYIINDKNVPLEIILIVTRGYNNSDVTATMRHSIKVLPAKSYAKIEFLQDEVLRLNNEFLVSFFEDNKMYERKFVFPQDSITEAAAVNLPVMNLKGVLAT